MNTLIRSPSQPAPLSRYNTYTSWPGGVDPSTPLFNTDNQKIGGRRASRKNSKKNSRKASKNSKKNSRKASKNSKKNTRKNSKKNSRR